MQNIVYIKKYILDESGSKTKVIFKKIVYYFKLLFNIITKNKIDGYEIWLIPVIKKYSKNRISKIIKKFKNKNNIYILQECLKTKDVYSAIKYYDVQLYNNEIIKKLLIEKVLE